jgi:hypothetical protein
MPNIFFCLNRIFFEETEMSGLLGEIQGLRDLASEFSKMEKANVEEEKRQILEKLRDHFAAISMRSIIEIVNDDEKIDCYIIADASYRMADAMMRRRRVRPDEDADCPGPEPESAWVIGQPPVQSGGKAILAKIGLIEANPVVVQLHGNGVVIVGTNAIRTYSSVAAWCEIPK